MNPNTRFSENAALLASIDPVSQAPGTVATAWVPVALFHCFCVIVATGVLGAAATVDAKLQQAMSAAGAGAKDIAGKSLTQIVKATGDNKQALIEARADDLDGNGGYTHVRLSITVGTAASILAAQLLGTNPRYMPASADNAASVLQVV